MITETLTAGGAETFVVRLANALAADHQVAIAVLHGEMVNSAIVAKVAPEVAVERLRLPFKRWLFRLDTLLRRIGLDASIIRHLQDRWLSALVGRFAPDVLHSHLLKADRAASDLCAGQPGLRHVLTLHGDYAPVLHGQADPHMLDAPKHMAAIVAAADAIAAICAEQVDFVAEQYPQASEKTRLIYNGYAPWNGAPPSSAANDGRAPLKFGMVSRGVERKGWAKAIAAFGSLPPGSARLILVGEGPYLDNLRRGGVPEGIEFAGFSPDPVEWIETFDVGLLPTEFPHESLPTVVMEYLFCGKPVIATDVGEIGAMMRTPEGGLAGTLIDYDGDRISTDQLAAAMKAYLDDPKLRERHAALSKAAFAKFAMGVSVEAYSRLYTEVVGGPSSSSISASH